EQVQAQQAPDLNAIVADSRKFLQKEPKMDLPDKFNRSRNKFREFLNQVRLIIRIQPNHYPTGETQVGLLGSLLIGPALFWFVPLLERNSPVLEDFETLIAEFEIIFGDADKARTASNKIQKLSQDPRLAATYALEFRQITSDLDWGEAALINKFRASLRDDIKDLLLSIEDPTDLNDTITKAVRCDNCLFERCQKQQQNTYQSWNQLTNTNKISGSSPEPIQIDNIQPRTLTEAEKKKRRTYNLCLYCGNPGHIVRSCPKKSRQQHKISSVEAINLEEISGKEEFQPQ
ncbi:17148_t:CDS:2, partial [Racocetra persica]